MSWVTGSIAPCGRSGGQKRAQGPTLQLIMTHDQMNSLTRALLYHILPFSNRIVRHLSTTNAIESAFFDNISEVRQRPDRRIVDRN